MIKVCKNSILKPDYTNTIIIISSRLAFETWNQINFYVMLGSYDLAEKFAIIFHLLRLEKKKLF